MQMTEEQRSKTADALLVPMGALIGRHVGIAGGDDGDCSSIMVTTAIRMAVMVLTGTAMNAKSAVALVTCMAEASAQDIYGAAA